MKTPFILPSILGIALGLASGLAVAADAPQDNPPAETNWLSTLNLSGVEQGWGEAHSDRSVNNEKLTVAGRVFERGIGTHANSSIPLELDGNALVLSGWAGLDDETDGRGSVVFQIQADGKELWNSGLMKSKAAAKEFSLAVFNSFIVEP